jgi:hypothetical protein
MPTQVGAEGAYAALNLGLVLVLVLVLVLR